ncbi:MAG TPA: SpoIIE family protein phosphatase [Thermotogota bacterium]|nr:SpoIIE family protein phosphatase [Thermotogota bacterium]HRW34861.1 SpoIIE family protein phosphatase [Thermotogota bacterium]
MNGLNDWTIKRGILLNKSRSLNQVFISIVIIIYMITILFSAFVFFSTSERISGGYLKRYIQTQNELGVRTILSFMEKEIAMSRKLAQDPLIQKWVVNQQDKDLTRQVQEQLDNYRDFISSGTHFLAVKSSLNYYLEDIEQPAKTLKKDSTADNWFFEALERNEDYSLNVDYQESLGEIRLWINVTVRDENGNAIGLAGSGIYINDFLNEIIIHEDNNLKTVLINDQGQIQGHEDRTIMDQNGMSKTDETKITIYDLLKDQQESKLIQQMIYEIKDSSSIKILELKYEGKDCMAAMGFIPQLNWYNLVMIEKDTVMSWRDFLPLILLFVVSALVIILSIIFFFTKLITKPIRKLTLAAEVISKGDYDIHIPVEKENEIGLLGISFNTMTEKVKQYTENLEFLVDERTKELQQTNEELFSAQKRILDSIEYAKLLQSSILPTQVEMDKHFSEYFVLYEPLDIVGGDFYFLKQTEDSIWIAGIDCTGHGVPGAFMTMMANVLLKDILEVNSESGPEEILQKFHFKLKDSLKSQSKFDHLDNGLDMALCKISFQKERLEYSGADLPLIYTDEDGVHEIRGDALHIGYNIDKEYVFTQHDIKLKSGMTFYLLTDGILDYPGGKKGFGLGRNGLMNILKSISRLPLKTQKETIYKQLMDYKGSYKKKDDLLMIGFKL